MTSLAIIIPFYNEAQCLPGLINELDGIINKIDGQITVFAVNDGSKDETASLLNQYAETRPWLKVIHQNNAGHGQAIFNGYQKALSENFDWIFQCDSDQQIPLNDLISLWNSKDNTTVTLGVRADRQDPSERLFVSSILKIVIRLVFGVSLQDPNCPFRLFPGAILKKLIEHVPNKAFAPNIFLSILAKSNTPVLEVFVSHAKRQAGTNSINRVNLLKVCWRSFKELLKFWLKKNIWHKKLFTPLSSL